MEQPGENMFRTHLSVRPMKTHWGDRRTVNSSMVWRMESSSIPCMCSSWCPCSRGTWSGCSRFRSHVGQD
eukprot:14211486-Alexandrium_andersonii.AAC.1